MLGICAPRTRRCRQLKQDWNFGRENVGSPKLRFQTTSPVAKLLKRRGDRKARSFRTETVVRAGVKIGFDVSRRPPEILEIGSASIAASTPLHCVFVAWARCQGPRWLPNQRIGFLLACLFHSGYQEADEHWSDGVEGRCIAQPPPSAPAR